VGRQSGSRSGSDRASGVISYTVVSVPHHRHRQQLRVLPWRWAISTADGFDEVLVTKVRPKRWEANAPERCVCWSYAARNGVPSLVQTIVPPQNSGYGSSVSVGDLDGDGLSDVAVGATGAG
jgi:hypothetical protein